MTPALGTESREADHPGRVSGMKVGMSPKGLDSELRILSPSFKGPVCSFPALKPSEKGKPCLPSMCWIPLLLRRPVPRSLLEISVRAFTSTCPQPRKTCGPSDHQVRASLVQEQSCGFQKHSSLILALSAVWRFSVSPSVED